MSDSGINLAKAYVQIVPSAKGIKNNLSNLLNNEAGNAGTSAGEKLVSGIKKVITAAGIGKVLQATISEGAAVEQSIGGIETLFKNSADKVIASAQNAYRTAGMSANEYMETVTGFSASLLQGLSGDTNKAADIADMALTDMSDNANKMGTDMESIQNAYQGFAKQNYTMLDNLKLGYGGTKTEMERLLKDAQEISGVEYDIDNLSDVYSAIHVIQSEMDITGTTAKEAATTLSGSFASMKGAVQTFLGNVAIGADLQESFNAVYQTAHTFLFGNLLPMIGNVVTGFGKTIINTDWAYLATEMITDLCSAIGGAAENTLKNDGSIVDAIIAAVNEKLPEVINKGVDLVLKLATGMLNNLPKLITTAGELATKFIQCIIDNAPKVLNSGLRLVSELATGLINNLPKIISAATSVATKILSTILENAPKMLQGGLTLIGQVAAGILKAAPALIAKIPGIVKDIIKQFTEIKWGEIGKNIIAGIAKGITNGVSKIIDAAKEAAGDALKAAKKALGINSPSRAFRDDVGEQSIEGWILGVKSKANTLAETMKDISKQSVEAVDIEALISAGVLGSTGDNLTVWDGNQDLKELFNYVMDVMERYGDKQAEALITAISSMKMFANNREIARFMSNLGFSRG